MLASNLKHLTGDTLTRRGSNPTRPTKSPGHFALVGPAKTVGPTYGRESNQRAASRRRQPIDPESFLAPSAATKAAPGRPAWGPEVTLDAACPATKAGNWEAHPYQGRVCLVLTTRGTATGAGRGVR